MNSHFCLNQWLKEKKGFAYLFSKVRINDQELLLRSLRFNLLCLNRVGQDKRKKISTSAYKSMLR